MQMIFQDPISSLNPRRRVRDVVAEGLNVWSKGDDTGEIQAKVDEVLEAVGLDPAIAANRYAHEFSGGQCQRISIARAVAIDPEILICDEPVSALDVSVQAQILNLLKELHDQYDDIEVHLIPMATSFHLATVVEDMIHDNFEDDPHKCTSDVMIISLSLIHI